MATPVYAELAAALVDHERRLIQCGARAIEHRRTRLAAAARSLPRPTDLLAIATQGLDLVAGRLGAALQRNVAAHRHDLSAAASPLKPGLLTGSIQVKTQRLETVSVRLAPSASRRIARLAERLESVDKLRLSFEPYGPLRRGFALVRRADGHLARSAAALESGEEIRLTFADGDRNATVDGEPPFRLRP